MTLQDREAAEEKVCCDQSKDDERAETSHRDNCTKDAIGEARLALEYPRSRRWIRALDIDNAHAPSLPKVARTLDRFWLLEGEQLENSPQRQS